MTKLFNTKEAAIEAAIEVANNQGTGTSVIESLEDNTFSIAWGKVTEEDFSGMYGKVVPRKGTHRVAAVIDWNPFDGAKEG